MNRREFIAACVAFPVAGKVKPEPVVDYGGAFTIGMWIDRPLSADEILRMYEDGKLRCVTNHKQS